MGADTFQQTGMGKTPQEAFLNAREAAFYEYGHRGYTGSLAEKTSFVLISDTAEQVVKRCEEAGEYYSSGLLGKNPSPENIASALIALDDTRIANKWGPAGCIATKDNVYLFFGWASS